MALTYPETAHPTPFPPWPAGTVQPAHGATVLAGGALGDAAGRRELLAEASTKTQAEGTAPTATTTPPGTQPRVREMGPTIATTPTGSRHGGAWEH